jgi:HK97 family phage portal protein
MAQYRTAIPEYEVLGLPAFNRGKNLIGGLIAQMPLVDRKDDGTPWADNPIMTDPWPVMGPAEWISFQIDALIMTGDAMAIPVDFDAGGYARQLVPIDPRRVLVYVEDGQVWYDIYTSTGGVITLPRSQMFHAKGLTLTHDGLRGVGVIIQFALAMGLSSELMRYGFNAYTGAGVPSGVVKVNLRNVSQSQADGVKSDWLTSFRDKSPAVLSQLMDFTPISWSPVDMAFLESRRFSVSDIAYTLNLDPMDLDTTMGSSNTYHNREQKSYDRLLTSIGPYMVRLEQAFRFLVPRGHHATFDRSVILWADSLTRAQVQQLQLANGTMVLNEARAMEQRPLFGDWANEPFAQPPALEPPEPTPAGAENVPIVPSGEEPAAPETDVTNLGGAHTTSTPPSGPGATIAQHNSPARNPVQPRGPGAPPLHRPRAPIAVSAYTRRPPQRPQKGAPS